MTKGQRYTLARKMRRCTTDYLKQSESYYKLMANTLERRGNTTCGDYECATDMLDIIGAELARRGI